MISLVGSLRNGRTRRLAAIVIMIVSLLTTSVLAASCATVDGVELADPEGTDVADASATTDLVEQQPGGPVRLDDGSGIAAGVVDAPETSDLPTSTVPASLRPAAAGDVDDGGPIASAGVVTSVVPPTTAVDGVPVIDIATIEPGRDGLIVSLSAGLTEPGLMNTTLGGRIWVEGWGDVFRDNADLPMIPASNQKLATALAALEILGPDHRAVTRIVAASEPVDGIVAGDIVVVGGGDPVLGLDEVNALIRDHTILTLAALVKEAGVDVVQGDLLIDESHYDMVRAPETWKPGSIPESSGPLSAFMIADNLALKTNSALGEDPDFDGYLADPTNGNGRLLRDAFTAKGVRMQSGRFGGGSEPVDGFEVARLESPTVAELVIVMLRDSENVAAELLTKEIGLVVSGQGSTIAGTKAIDDLLSELLGPLSGTTVDGSGLSRVNSRPPGEWWRLLEWVTRSQWADDFNDGLAVGGAEKGTLRRRFRETPADGLVRAKTGFIDDVRALSGYSQTADGRLVIFSLIANGPETNRLTTVAIDALIDRLATHPD